ncbi:MAG: hypothetical protein HQK91_08630 [Nitrospirae bacterium]|nr:hypothetical protein [Nitrospirota bacterium]
MITIKREDDIYDKILNFTESNSKTIITVILVITVILFALLIIYQNYVIR